MKFLRRAEARQLIQRNNLVEQGVNHFLVMNSSFPVSRAVNGRAINVDRRATHVLRKVAHSLLLEKILYPETIERGQLRIAKVAANLEADLHYLTIQIGAGQLIEIDNLRTIFSHSRSVSEFVDPHHRIDPAPFFKDFQLFIGRAIHEEGFVLFKYAERKKVIEFIEKMRNKLVLKNMKRIVGWRTFENYFTAVDVFETMIRKEIRRRRAIGKKLP